MNFRSGPFEFNRAPKGATVGDTPMYRWAIYYGPQLLCEKMLPSEATQDAVREAFAAEIGSFTAAAIAEHHPDIYHLVTPEGDIIARVALEDLPGMTACIPDDRFPYWIVTAEKPARGEPVTLEKFAAVAAEHRPAPRGWIADLLPESVLTDDPESWTAPSNWHIRHVVGEGSFTGISGAKAAALIGVTPQNFRKYTAADDARTRQKISFAMWHLLLHKLGVQRL